LVLRIERKDQIRVGVHIYETGGDDEAVGMEHVRCGVRLDVPDAGDLAPVDAYIGPKAGPAGSIYEMALLDEEVVHSSFQNMEAMSNAKSSSKPKHPKEAQYIGCFGHLVIWILFSIRALEFGIQVDRFHAFSSAKRSCYAALWTIYALNNSPILFPRNFPASIRLTVRSAIPSMPIALAM
jgi:hypothetical protein